MHNFNHLRHQGAVNPFMSMANKGKGGGSAPPAPDYTGAAQATAASNAEAQMRADWANRPTQNTPWGTSSWESQSSIDPATGKPVTNWTQNISLSGDQQKALDDQMAIQSGRSEMAKDMLGAVGDSYQNKLDYSGMQDYGKVATPDDAARQRIEQGLFDRMQPQHERAQASLEGKLANMGLARGSEAWNREMERLGDQQSRERYDAMQTAGQEQARNFGMEMQGANYQNSLRQQQVAEALQQRNMPLNELNALLTGQQVQNPAMPNFAQSQAAGGVDYLGAANMGYGAQMDAYNAKQSQKQGLMSGLGGVASLAGMFMSDRRLKSNIRRIGTHKLGIGIYEYDIFGGRQIGVMAQELQEVAPHLVHETPSGYLAVNYGGL